MKTIPVGQLFCAEEHHFQERFTKIPVNSTENETFRRTTF